VLSEITRLHSLAVQPTFCDRLDWLRLQTFCYTFLTDVNMD